MIDSTPPRPIESTEPPADEAASRRHRRSRHQLRLPNDLTRMDAPDESTSPTDATVTQPDGASPLVALPPEPPPLEGAPTDLRPPAFASLAPPTTDVEVTLDTSNTVSVPPPPMPATQSSPPSDGASHNGVMRVVRRRVRMVGVDDRGNPMPSSIPTTMSTDTAVHVPPAPLPSLPDLGLDFSDAAPKPAESSEPPAPELSLDRISRIDAPARVVTPPPVPAVRVEESVPKRPSSPPPARRPSNPPPPMPMASAATGAAAQTSSATTSTPPAQSSTTPSSSLPPPPAAPSTTSALTATPKPPAPPQPPVSAVASPPPIPTTARPSSLPGRPDAPKAEALKTEAPKTEIAKFEAPKGELAKIETPKPETPKPEAPKAEEQTAEPAAAEEPAEPEAAHAIEDESVEVSLEEQSESPVSYSLSQPPRGVDPSLALLDELAELGHATPVESVDPDVIEHLEPAAARATSMPPPPPTDASRKGKGNGNAPSVKITGSPTVPDVRARRRRVWWEELFNEDYFRTVEKLTSAQVQGEADWIEHALGVEAGASILDVGCGAGRQAIELSRRRYEVTAVDLSMAMLTRASEAAQEAEARVVFQQCDMAAMEFEEQFDAAFCVGSTFGFFDDPRNAEVARRIHRALKPHGTFLLAVLNRDHAIQHQPAMSWFEGEGCVCMEESSFNYITSRVNVKRTMIYDDGRQREFEYSVRLYSLHELGQVLHEAGFRILEVSGHTRTPGAFFGPSSRELIILAQKRAPEVVELGDPNASDSSRPQ